MERWCVRMTIIVYDSKFDILYITTKAGYGEYARIAPNIYVRYNMENENEVVGMMIEEFSKMVDKDCIDGLINRLYEVD